MNHFISLMCTIEYETLALPTYVSLKKTKYNIDNNLSPAKLDF